MLVRSVQKTVNCHGKAADVKEHGLSRSVARVAKRKVGGRDVRVSCRMLASSSRIRVRDAYISFRPGYS